MRMRRKKNLEERLASFDNIILIPRVTDDHRAITAQKEYIDFSEKFGNSNPIHMEIGCGKGQFIFELAARTPDINYIAVEVNESVISDACKKAKEAGIKNVIFMKCGAEILTKYIKPASIGKLYLNFSCPLPKKANENRRLTNVKFLEIYKEYLLLMPKYIKKPTICISLNTQLNSTHLQASSLKIFHLIFIKVILRATS